MQKKVEQHLIQLNLDVCELSKQLPAHLTLSFNDGVLSLCEVDNPRVALSVSFDSGSLLYRSQQHLGGENVVKACQLKNQQGVEVLDATCGLGVDAFLLSQAGFKVTAFEKHPIVHALLCNGLNRFEKSHSSKAFELVYEDSALNMKHNDYDVIYLDPMFPHRNKTAKNKKGMQLFQDLYHQAEDNAELLITTAMQSNCKRVVIKRPKKAPLLTVSKPTFQIIGKTCRFDAYQIR